MLIIFACMMPIDFDISYSRPMMPLPPFFSVPAHIASLHAPFSPMIFRPPPH